MAEWTEEIQHIWFKCEDCPFTHPIMDDNGFGTGYTCVGYTCKENGFTFVKRLPDFIPVHCKYSPHDLNSIKSIEDLLGLSDREIQGFIAYKKNKFNDERH